MKIKSYTKCWKKEKKIYLEVAWMSKFPTTICTGETTLIVMN